MSIHHRCWIPYSLIRCMIVTTSPFDLYWYTMFINCNQQSYYNAATCSFDLNQWCLDNIFALLVNYHLSETPVHLWLLSSASSWAALPVHVWVSSQVTSTRHNVSLMANHVRGCWLESRIICDQLKSDQLELSLNSWNPISWDWVIIYMRYMHGKYITWCQ